MSRRTITEDRPAIFCEALRGRTEERLQVLLDEFGYDTWWLGPDGPVHRGRIDGHPEFLNWLFLPRGTQPIPNPA